MTLPAPRIFSDSSNARLEVTRIWSVLEIQ
jgi:hypothetical protein